MYAVLMLSNALLSLSPSNQPRPRAFSVSNQGTSPALTAVISATVGCLGDQPKQGQIQWQSGLLCNAQSPLDCMFVRDTEYMNPGSAWLGSAHGPAEGCWSRQCLASPVEEVARQWLKGLQICQRRVSAVADHDCHQGMSLMSESPARPGACIDGCHKPGLIPLPQKAGCGKPSIDRLAKA